MNLSQALLRALHDHGAREIFGIPMLHEIVLGTRAEIEHHRAAMRLLPGHYESGMAGSIEVATPISS